MKRSEAYEQILDKLSRRHNEEAIKQTIDKVYDGFNAELDEFYEKIKHGSDEHREWLRNAINEIKENRWRNI